MTLTKTPAPLPALFLSHGAPDLPIRSGATPDFLRSLPGRFAKPQAILILSAHWCTTVPTVSLDPHPATKHDFAGFPEALFRLTYPAPGDSVLGDRLVTLLESAGYSIQTTARRSYDHGVWAPLMLMYPQADIPVVQLSLPWGQTPMAYWRLGAALEPLRHGGVLVVGSGSATHNLSAFDPDYTAPPPPWVRAFDDWLAMVIATGRWHDVLNYRQLAPFARENHPTEEHFWPLMVMLGAAGDKGTVLHRGYTYGAFSMAAFAFGDDV